MRYVILLGPLLAVASCQSNVDAYPDFVGNYSPIHPYNTEGETSYVIRVLDGGRAMYEDTSCFDTGSEPREGRWEARGNRLVFLPLSDGELIFDAWRTDEAFLEEDGCGTARVSYQFPLGPNETEDFSIELFRYEPCYVSDPLPGNGDEGVSGCLTVRCDDLPDCDFGS